MEVVEVEVVELSCSSEEHDSRERLFENTAELAEVAIKGFLISVVVVLFEHDADTDSFAIFSHEVEDFHVVHDCGVADLESEDAVTDADFSLSVEEEAQVEETHSAKELLVEILTLAFSHEEEWVHVPIFGS